MSGMEFPPIGYATPSPAATPEGLQHLETTRRGLLIQRIEELSDHALNNFIHYPHTKVELGQWAGKAIAHAPFRAFGQNTRSAPAIMQAPPRRTISTPTISCQYQPLINTLPVFKLYGESPNECLELYRSQNLHSWETIFSRLTAETWEALVLLYHQLDKSKIPTYASVLAFAAELILSLPPCEAECRIGKLIYALDTDAAETIKAMNCSHMAQKIHWIDDRFKNVINGIRERLDHTKTLLQETGFQEAADLVYYVNLMKELSELLLTSRGDINCSIRECLMIEFVLQDPHPTSYQKALGRGLKHLHCDDIRGKIQQVKKPLYNNSTACHLIRLNLNKEGDSPISDLDAKKTALAAFLSHLRQGSVGSCFATSIGIVLLNSLPEKCWDDFASLLLMGKLVRIIDGVCRDFPFLMLISNSNINEQCILNKEGFLQNNLMPLHHISALPGIAAACRSVGIKDIFNVMNDIVAEQFVGTKIQSCKKISIHTLLKKIADHAIARTSPPPQYHSQFYHLATFAYESQMCNPLLKAWENSLAEMSEGKDESMVTPSIHYSLLATLKQKIALLTGISTADADNDKVLAHIKEELIRRLHLHYDPNIQNEATLSHTQQNKGGFLIYDKKNEVKPLNWTRIDNPKTFQEFVLSMIQNVKQELLTKESATFKSPKWKNIFKELTSYADSDLFIHNILCLYYPKNADVINRGGSWKQLEYTPWRTICGNIAQSVLEVYMEKPVKHPTIKLNPHNATLLLTTIIDMLRGLPEARKKILRNDPFQRIPIYTLPHAFSLLAGHPTLVAAMDSPLPTNEWVECHLIQPGRALAESMSNLPAGRSLETDIQFYENLSSEIKQQMGQHIVHIADTNWGKGSRDHHIGICFDRLSDSLQVMKVLDDDSHISPIPEPEMFLCEWEIMENPYDILPTNEIC